MLFRSQNYPNPFNPSTNIEFSLPVSSKVNLSVYDITGKETAVLFNGFLERGSYNYHFEPDNLSSGLYIYILRAGDAVQTKRMLLVK